MKAYISGALTNVPDPDVTKALYEEIGNVCEEIGISAYIPHKHTDPDINKDVTPETVFMVDKQEVLTSDLIIAYVGIQSLGVGMELGLAFTNNIPVILLYESNQRISRMILGIPENIKVADVVFDDSQDAVTKLKTTLIYWLDEKSNSKDDIDITQGGFIKEPITLRIETEKQNFVVNIEDKQNPFEKLSEKLSSLQERGVSPSKIYVNLWQYSQIRDVISSVWLDVPLLAEYKD